MSDLSEGHENGSDRAGGLRRYTKPIVAAALLAEVAGIWLRTGRLGGNVAVRCRKGHVFTTIWIPGASLKSVRLAGWRFQYCPVGRHWSIVTPVKESELTKKEARSASKHRDVRIP
jgi:hypothetical protein